MNLTAVSRVLNESDLIEAFVRHTAYFVDHHVFVDNGSVDGTLQILESLKNEGFGITVFQSNARTFVERKINTFLFHTAVGVFKADWVIFLDVDEFVDDRKLKQPLRDCIAGFAARHGETACMEVPLREYHITPEDSAELIVPIRITNCSPVSATVKVVVPGILVQRQAAIQPGNNSVVIDDGTLCAAFREPTLTYAHFAARSVYQWMSKSVIGWAKVLAAGSEKIDAGHGIHYKAPFELLRTDAKAILRNPILMSMPATPAARTHDPIRYRGGSLKYTLETDYPMRAVQVMMQYLHELAGQHGEMLEQTKRLSSLIDRTESGVTQIL